MVIFPNFRGWEHYPLETAPETLDDRLSRFGSPDGQLF